MSDLVWVAIIAAVPTTVGAIGNWRNGRKLDAVRTGVDTVRTGVNTVHDAVNGGMKALKLELKRAKQEIVNLKRNAKERTKK